MDEVPHDQEVGGVAHVGDHLELVLEALVLLRGGIRVASAETVLAEAAEVLVRGQVAGDLVAGQQHAPELDRQVAHRRHGSRVGDGLLDLGEGRAHLGGVFEVEAVAGEAHPVLVRDPLAGLDAEQDVVHAGVALGGVVRVVGRHQRDAGSAGHLDDPGPGDVLLRDAVVLDLQEIAVAKDPAVLLGDFYGAVDVAGDDPLADLAGEAGRQGDDSLGVRRQQLLVDPRPHVIAVEVGDADHLHQVLVADLVLRQQHQVMGVPVDPALLVAQAALGDVRLATDDGLHPSLSAGLVEGHHAIQRSVVGDRQGVLPGGDSCPDDLTNAAGAVEEAVLGMGVKVDEVRQAGVRTGTPGRRRISTISMLCAAGLGAPLPGRGGL